MSATTYLMLSMMALSVSVQAQTCQEYTTHLRQSEEHLTAMPSSSIDERRAKQRAALAQAAYIDTTDVPCRYQGVDFQRRYRDWVRLVRLQAEAESLWPGLSDEAAFRTGVALARAATDPHVGLHRLYRPQANEYHARILHDYARHLGLQSDKARGLLEDADRAYERAERLYARLSDDEQYSITRYEMRGYRAQVFASQGRYQEAYCAAAWALSQVRGTESKERVFRSRMRRLLDDIDATGKADPRRCDGRGGLSDGRTAWSVWTLVAVCFAFLAAVVVTVHLARRPTKSYPLEKRFLNFNGVD